MQLRARRLRYDFDKIQPPLGDFVADGLTERLVSGQILGILRLLVRDRGIVVYGSRGIVVEGDQQFLPQYCRGNPFQACLSGSVASNGFDSTVDAGACGAASDPTIVEPTGGVAEVGTGVSFTEETWGGKDWLSLNCADTSKPV